MTCRFLCDFARIHIQKRYYEDVPPSWNGDRVVCAGSRSSVDEEFAQSLIGERGGAEWTADGGQNLFDFARQHYKEVVPRPQVIDKFDARAMQYVQDAERPNFELQDLKNSYTVLGLCGSHKPVAAEGEPSGTGAIRNLSKKERSMFAKRPSIVAVVWLRTAWSMHSSIGLRHNLLLGPQHNPISAHQGQWAGDRLDFVANMEFLETEVVENGLPVEWNDESHCVVRDLFKVWSRVRQEADDIGRAALGAGAYGDPINTVVDFTVPGW